MDFHWWFLTQFFFILEFFFSFHSFIYISDSKYLYKWTCKRAFIGTLTRTSYTHSLICTAAHYYMQFNLFGECNSDVLLLLLLLLQLLRCYGPIQLYCVEQCIRERVCIIWFSTTIGQCLQLQYAFQFLLSSPILPLTKYPILFCCTDDRVWFNGNLKKKKNNQPLNKTYDYIGNFINCNFVHNFISKHEFLHWINF